MLLNNLHFISAMKKSGGVCCTVPTCSVNFNQCKGVSFHRLPKKGQGPEKDTWRAQLIHAICRSDKSFNAETAKICSRHFDDNCFFESKSCMYVYCNN